MVKINLLPWREERRQQMTNEFYVMLVAGIILALLIAGTAYYYFDQSIKFQNKRNQYMTDEIAKLDRQIAEIKELEAKKASLISRQQVIEELQANRTQMVHLFDELVKTIPNGVFLENIKQSGVRLTVEGYAQSYARISDYMDQLKASDWFAGVDVVLIKNDDTLTSHEQKFKLSANLTNPNKKKSDSKVEEVDA
ncbi:PilN domain-containing protein [Marinicella rhabdoformis]|uniref:PilN domain-containing protein n=1 Tax=Marinicella rhabdoformis TaxID=2580566 RepID=UPI0012AEC897|nr:PilN domain-containing protein [Marinicella rhabdoformis]